MALSLIKASAGSGKTFRLTSEYLRLIMEDDKRYRKILAITFTNKAAEEMKTRIISELNSLSKGAVTPIGNLLMHELDKTAEQLQQKAEIVLRCILHDYSRFNVSTIDTFFQRIIRNFTAETGLQSSYRIELNSHAVLNEAVTSLIEGMAEDNELRKWLLMMAENRIDEGKKWDFQSEIRKLGFELFKETYKAYEVQLSGCISDKDAMHKYIDSLTATMHNFEKAMRALGEDALKTLASADLTPEDLAGKSRSFAMYFKKLRDGKQYAPGDSQRSALDNKEKWISKSTEKKNQIESVYPKLHPILERIISYYDDQSSLYNSAEAILAQIYALGIVTDLSRKIRQYCNDQNLFLLSDNAHLLYEIVKLNDAPFIFEKAGNQFWHYMLDEFQDTSEMQWDNIRKLLEDSLASGNQNLIVGDVKQAIYRWRNSNREIFATEVESVFGADCINAEILETNWRSQAKIIQFNNDFFKTASSLLQEKASNYLDSTFPEEANLIKYKVMISNAYLNTHQESPKSKNKDDGFVKIEFITEEDDATYNELANNKILENIRLLEDNGYMAGDIAILVRSKREGTLIADLLMAEKVKNTDNKYCFDIISEESLHLDGSSAVKFILSILRYLKDNTDEIHAAFAIHEYLKYLTVENEVLDATDLFMSIHKGGIKNLIELINNNFTVADLIRIKELPIYEAVGNIISLFELNTITSELPYLEGFLDLTLKYTTDNSSGLSQFLDFWDKNGITSTVPLPSNHNAIRILTIHKSKGLEFEVVIVPYCKWETEINAFHSNLIWCQTESTPFSSVPLLPIKYGKTMESSVFYKEYVDEKIQSNIDNLNLLYVAFTRPKKVLIAFCKNDDEPDKLKNVSQLLLSYCMLPTQNTKYDMAKGVYIEGTLKSTLDRKKVVEENIFFDHLKCSPFQKKLQMRLNYEKESKEASDISNLLEYGRVMHEIFRHIIKVDDVEKALTIVLNQGLIRAEQQAPLQKLIKDRLHGKNWFDGSWNVRTECDFICPEGGVYRPDRVMFKGNKTLIVDFKFGNKYSETHHEQVQGYLEKLNEMGYSDAEGYLWYVGKDELELVISGGVRSNEKCS